MSKKVIFPLIAVCGLGMAAGSFGCHAEARIATEPKVEAPPPPPPPPPPVAEAPPPPKPIRAVGKAKIEKDEIKIPGKVHFDTDKATIKEDKETKEILQTVADVLKENTQITKLRIEGHTDDVGGKDHNQKLSQDRAQAVVDWLGRSGVDRSRLDSRGWGEDHPVSKNDTAPNREQNRRVEFKLWELDSKPTEAAKNEVAATATATTATGITPATGTGATATGTTPAAKKAATPAAKKP